jgi:hypothetical protein
MTVLLILLLVAAVTLIGLAVANVVKNDGYGRPTAGRTPPRSHVPDLFDPRRVA